MFCVQLLQKHEVDMQYFDINFHIKKKKEREKESIL